jgi:phosphotriesterase-related protein
MPEPVIRTVLGDVPASQAGRVLIHEHLQIDLRPMLDAHEYKAQSGRLTLESAAAARWNPGAFSENYVLDDVSQIAAEVSAVKAHGCRTVVDATPCHLGRNPTGLSEIARETGLNVVMGSGYYVKATHPAEVGGLDVAALEDLLERDITLGDPASGARPGIIGELGTSGSIDDDEVSVLRAAARVQARVGLSVFVHCHPWTYEGEKIVSILTSAGAEPARIVLLHQTTAVGEREYLRRLLATGVMLSFDLFGFDHSCLGLGRYPPSDFDAVAAIAELVDAGFADQLLLSHDIGVRTRLKRYGGWGYTHLFENVASVFMERGLTDEFECMLTTNAASVLEVRLANDQHVKEDGRA